MKIAGRKNDGAWFRSNRAIQVLAEFQRGVLAQKISESAFIDAFLNVMQGICDEVGFEAGSFSDPLTYAQQLVGPGQGIPRQLWLGKLTHTIYDKTTIDGVDRYIPRGQSEAHYFAKDLRKIVTKFIFANRELNDLQDIGGADTGNPGGQPDANIDT